jgi:hypothetical protein
MKYSQTCHHCTHQVTAYTLNLNESMVQAFITFIEKFLEEGRPLKKSEIGLTNSQYTNFPNLRYHGILALDGEGCIEPTELGMKFYYGEVGLMLPSAHMGGKSLPSDHPAWDTHDKPRQLKYITDLFPTHFKQRPEFAAEKAGAMEYSQNSLF